MIVAITVKAGVTESVTGPIYGIRNLTAAPGAKVQLNNGAEHRLSDVLRVMRDRLPYGHAKFTGGSRDIEIELALSADDEFDGSATVAPEPAPVRPRADSPVPGWELVQDATIQLLAAGGDSFIALDDLGRQFRRVASYFETLTSGAWVAADIVNIKPLIGPPSTAYGLPYTAEHDAMFPALALSGDSVNHMSVIEWGAGSDVDNGRYRCRAAMPVSFRYKLTYAANLERFSVRHRCVGLRG